MYVNIPTILRTLFKKYLPDHRMYWQSGFLQLLRYLSRHLNSFAILADLASQGAATITSLLLSHKLIGEEGFISTPFYVNVKTCWGKVTTQNSGCSPNKTSCRLHQFQTRVGTFKLRSGTYKLAKTAIHRYKFFTQRYQNFIPRYI
jgi:hypothetical protein